MVDDDSYGEGRVVDEAVSEARQRLEDAGEGRVWTGRSPKQTPLGGNLLKRLREERR